MPEVFIIMGHRDSRKSATIRALTGALFRKQYDIATATNIIRCFVQIRALQEDNISPKKFIADMNSLNVNNILLSLKIKGTRRQNVKGIDYINVFIKEGWTIGHLVILNADNISSVPRGCPQPLFIPNSVTTPANKIASQVRKSWQWL
jgi:hypothetical protein